MSRYLIDRIERDERIEVRPETEVHELLGEARLSGVVLETAPTEKRAVLDACAVFVFTGAEPRTGWVADSVALDPAGFVLAGVNVTDETRPCLPLETTVTGVFAAGDVRSGSTKRVAAAVGEGAMAINSVHQRLRMPAADRARPVST